MESLSNQTTVADFFDLISGEYDESIFRACPVYVEMLDALMDYLWLDVQEPVRILELGCGTGNLTRLLAERFPKALFTVVDLSAEMLIKTREKLRGLPNLSLKAIQSGFSDLTEESLAIKDEPFDLIVSSLALHHLLDPEKETLYQNMYAWLRPGGKFRCVDQCLTIPVDMGDKVNMRAWMRLALEKGAAQNEIDAWVVHMEEFDHHTSMANHFEWLTKAALINPDVYWRKLYWAVFGAEKALTR